MSSLQDFLYPQLPRNSAVHPQRSPFGAHLQTFAQKVGYIACLETGGKISQEESYQAIASLMEDLACHRKQKS